MMGRMETITGKIWLFCSRKEAAYRALFLLWCLALVSVAWAQSPWHTEVVDDGGGANVGKAASLAIDSQGNVHIAYYDESHHGLWYTYRAKGESKWYKMPVAANVVPYLSLAVDSQGQPHISWVDIRESGLHYTYWDGKVWHPQTVDPAHANFYNELRLDKAGHPRISYYEDYDPTWHYALHLKYAYFDGKQWFIQTVDRRPDEGKSNSIALDAAGLPYIAYTDVASGDLRYAHWDGSQWHMQQADMRQLTNSYVGMGNSIAVDGAGHPHIAYFDASKRLVKYAVWTGKSWETELVDRVANRAEMDHVSLKLDAQGEPHIAYYDGGTGVLKYAVRQNKGWHIDIVDQEGNVGMNPSLILDGQGTPYIAYYDLDRHALKLAFRSGNVQRAVAASK